MLILQVDNIIQYSFESDCAWLQHVPTTLRAAISGKTFVSSERFWFEITSALKSQENPRDFQDSPRRDQENPEKALVESQESTKIAEDQRVGLESVP